MRVANIPSELRGLGTTTQQMKLAPQSALFIWPVANLSYPKDLARNLGRSDLMVVGPAALDDGGRRLLGLRISGVVVDHACEMDERDLDALRNIEIRCVRTAGTLRT